jgi:hypothetical protein
MGIIFILLTAVQAANVPEEAATMAPRPFEVVLACHFAISTLFTS